MVEQARRLNPDIQFQEGNRMVLAILDRALAGIVAFYAIVNIPKPCLPAVFREMANFCGFVSFSRPQLFNARGTEL
jgi:hypothetical protein